MRINSINNTSFSSTFIKNSLYNGTITYAQNQLFESPFKNTQVLNDSNELANALYYIKYDGKQDVYRLELQKGSETGVILRKNGEKVASSNDEDKNRPVNSAEVIKTYVRENLREDLSKDQTVSQSVTNRLERMCAYLGKNEERYFGVIDEKYKEPYQKKERDTKKTEFRTNLNCLDRYNSITYDKARKEVKSKLENARNKM